MTLRTLPLCVLLAAACLSPVACKAKVKLSSREQAIVSALEAKGRKTKAEAIKSFCTTKATTACACAEEAAKHGLDEDLHQEAVAALDGAACGTDGAIPGLRAEILVRSGKIEEGKAAATKLSTGADPGGHATYALAQAAFANGDMGTAMNLATAAADRGRGAAALTLTGLVAFHANDLPRALTAFDRAQQLDPEDGGAAYNAALVHHRMQRYHDAREGYLKALRINPKNADARYNLTILTMDAGATQEAEHHLRKLREIAPNDPRVATLAAKIATPRPAPAASSGVAPAASASAR